MNRQIRLFGLVISLLFLVLFVQLNVTQIYGRESLQDNPQNTRAAVRDFNRSRGLIATADGVVVARSIELSDESEFEFEREYPEGELYAHTVGYVSFNFGAEGLEREYNDQLSGQADEQLFSSLSSLFREEDTSANLTLTLRDDVQRVARDALGARHGSVVALDPRTGEILALWSYPSFDPNSLVTLDFEAANAARSELLANPENPLLAKFYRETFAPGSTFKVVTAGSALDSGRANQVEPVFDFVSSYTFPGTTVPIRNFGGSVCGGNLGDILRVSCNSGFAELGAEILGPRPLTDTAERFGFNEAPPIDLPFAEPSIFPTDYGAFVGDNDREPPAEVYENSSLVAQASIGQYDVRSTPLQMAMVAAAVANGGDLMQPYVVQELRDQEGGLIDETQPSLWRPAMAPSQAAVLRDLMVSVVTGGTATGLAIPGFEVGGKTGTAEIGVSPTGDTHAWIIGFAGPPGAPPEVAVAVLVEAREGGGQQTGGTVAAPIARAVLEAALATG